MASNAAFWNRRTFCLITGASQGIGRQIAIDFAKKVADQSAFLLLSRNIDNLNETKTHIQKANPNVEVFTHSVDLNHPIGVELHKIIGLSLTVFKTEPTDYELALLVHNAGTLGDISELTVEMRNHEKLTDYLNLNLHSVIILTAEFLKTFDIEASKPEIAFVNITSLCAIQPIASMGYYCIGKAAREMYFKVLAEENQNFTILSYSPGPVGTEMIDDIIANVRVEKVRQMFADMKRDSKLLTTEQTVGRLVSVLGERAFKNGSRKDFYDE